MCPVACNYRDIRCEHAIFYRLVSKKRLFLLMTKIGGTVGPLSSSTTSYGFLLLNAHYTCF